MSDTEKIKRLCEIYQNYRKYLPGDNRTDWEMEDLLQDVFLNAFSHLSQLEDIACMDAWINTIKHNEKVKYCIDKERKNQLQQRLEGTMSEFCDDVNERYRDIIFDKCRFSFCEYEQLVNELSVKEKNILFLHFHVGLKYREIADMTKMNCNTVKSIVRRIRRKLMDKAETI